MSMNTERLPAVVAMTVLLLVVGRAATGSDADCRAFHRDCVEARAAGYPNPGICNVERLECPHGPVVRVPRPSYESQGDDRSHPERAVDGGHER